MLALIVLTVVAMLWVAAGRLSDRRAPDRIAIRVRTDHSAAPRHHRRRG